VFELQIRLARDVQSALHAEWTKSGFDPNRPIPSLEKDIRPKLDRITPELLNALYLAAPEMQRDDFVSAYISLAAEKLSTQGWSDASRRETLQALHAVRVKAAPALDRIHASGVLRIGTTGDYAPFTLLTGDELAGSDIELAKSLAQKLGVRPVFVRTTWARLVDDLALYKFDIAVGGVSVTPARQAVAAFSMPYTSGGKTIVTRCKDARRFRSLKAVDRREVRVIVNPGGTNEQFTRENLQHANIRVFPDNRSIFDEIRAGRADVMITDDVEVELQTHRHKDLCRPFNGTYTHSDKALLLSRDEKLLGAVNDWLAIEVQTGNPARLIEQFLQSPP
jgi:cyclohexadienyl dehydratase